MQQCALAVRRLDSILGCTNGSIASRWREVITPFTQQSCVQCGAHQYKTDVDKLGQVQWKATKMFGAGALAL